jgi:hypothetical protein
MIFERSTKIKDIFSQAGRAGCKKKQQQTNIKLNKYVGQHLL